MHSRLFAPRLQKNFNSYRLPNIWAHACYTSYALFGRARWRRAKKSTCERKKSIIIIIAIARNRIKFRHSGAHWNWYSCSIYPSNRQSIIFNSRFQAFQSIILRNSPDRTNTEPIKECNAIRGLTARSQPHFERAHAPQNKTTWMMCWMSARRIHHIVKACSACIIPFTRRLKYQRARNTKAIIYQ